MKIRPAHIIFLLALLWALPISAQYYISGHDNSRIHWKEIETQHFRIVYPEQLEWQALRLASYCDTFAYYNANELKINQKKRQTKPPIIIHASGSYSNGLSAWAPKRIELWPTPQQSGYSQPWMQQLALHEYRHELQMQAINQNTVGAVSSIIGEHFSGAVVGLFVPSWFLEGDATWAETVLSYAGRGRESAFLTPAQTMLTQQKPPSYYKAAFGSYKDYTPGDYLLGYLLVSYDKTIFDTANFWQNGLKRVSSDFWRLTPFYRRMQFKSHYDSAMAFWQNYWEPFFNESAESTEKQINTPQKHYTDYHLAGITDTSVIALKRGVRNVSSLVEILPDGNERLLAKTGSVYDNHLCFNRNRIAWTENTLHPRWNLYHTNLIVYDLANGKRVILTKNRNLFSPTIADNGQIAALELSDSLTWQIVFFDSSLRETTIKIALPDTMEYQHPAFSASCDSLFLTATGKNGKYILLINNLLNDNIRIKTVAGPFIHNIGRLAAHDGKLFAISDQSGVDRVVRYDDGEETTLSDNRFGIKEFVPNNKNNTLIYSRFTTIGYSIFSDTIGKCHRQTAHNFNSEAIAPATAKYAMPKGLANCATTNYNPTDYNHWKHLFNFHSWLPLYFNANTQDIGLGISAMSQNELSNSILQTNFLWDYNNQKPALSLNYQYLRLYPTINASAGFSGHEVRSDSTTYRYNQFSTGLSAAVPFRRYWHNHVLSMSLSGHYQFSQIHFASHIFDKPPTMNTFALGFGIQHNTAKASQYLYSPWLQSLSVTAGYGFGNLQDIYKISIAGTLHFPSPIPTHTLRLYAAVQNRTKSLFTLNNSLKTPRGFRHLNPNDIASSYQINYDFPICYPDKAWGPVVYFKRIYATLFADAMLMYDNGKFYKSLGAEININSNLFLITTPVTFGLRTSYLPDNSTVAFDVLFSIDV